MFEDVDGTRVERETGLIGCQMGVAHHGSLVRLVLFASYLRGPGFSAEKEEMYPENFLIF